jgi:hypothetical protein
VYDNQTYVKECESLFLDATYQNGSGVEVAHSGRQYASSKSFTALALPWLTTNVEGRLSLPRLSFRVLSLRFRGLGALASGYIIRAWGEFIYGEKQNTEK